MNSRRKGINLKSDKDDTIHAFNVSHAGAVGHVAT